MKLKSSASENIDSEGKSSQRSGFALSFNGTADYVTVPETPSLVTPHIGLAFWLKISSLPNRFSRIISKSDDSSNGFSVLFDSSVIRKVYLSVRNTEGKDFNTAAFNKPLEVGVWRHYAFSCYGSKIVAYENGEPLGTTTISRGLFLPNSLNNLVFGRACNSPGGYSSMILDDVRMYEKALSPKQVSEIYSGNNVDLDLVGYWTFDEGSGKVAVDKSPYSNDGIITGAEFVEVTSGQ